MTVEKIEAGRWIFSEGDVAEFSIYKLRSGKVSIHKSGRKIRDVEIKEGMQPIILGIAAALREDRKHGASVKAESDIEVVRIFIDHLRAILANEIPPDIKDEVSTMIKAIVMGNEITSLLIKYSELPHMELSIPDDVSPNTVEILSEISRLYSLITKDVDQLCKK